MNLNFLRTPGYTPELAEHIAPRPGQKIDVALLRKQLEWATAEHRKAGRGERSEWDQRFWCGTACCIAGHTALDVGWTHAENDDFSAVKDGEVGYVDLIAQEALGLTQQQAEALFSSRNTIADLWQCAAVITDGEIEIPADIEIPDFMFDRVH